MGYENIYGDSNSKMTGLGGNSASWSPQQWETTGNSLLLRIITIFKKASI